MTLFPKMAAINAAESRLVQSKRKLGLSVDSTRSALRAAITRPSNLVLVAVASGLSTFLLSHQHRPSIKSVPASSPGLVRTLVSMYGATVLTYVFQRGLATWKQIGSHANMPINSVADDQ